MAGQELGWFGRWPCQLLLMAADTGHFAEQSALLGAVAMD